MQLLWMSLFALGIVAADQITKFLVVTYIPLHTDCVVIPGIVNLTYVQNTGAAFSMFAGMQWLFALVFAAMTVTVLWFYWKKRSFFTTPEWWCIASIYGGALGNMIDRIRLGYVVDMVKPTFVNFAVFNLADCFIVCGCILLIIHLWFLNQAFWKDDKK